MTTKTLLYALILSTSLTAKATTLNVVCRLNPVESAKIVAQELAKHPEAKEQISDEGAIVVADLQNLSFTIENQNLIGGKMTTAFTPADAEFNHQGFTDQKSFDGVVNMSVNVASDKIHFEAQMDGWDHYSYNLKLDPQTQKAVLHGRFDYDCGGDGSDMYAVYDCSLSNQ